jgi:large subunit ribosomal protein L35
MKKAVSRRIKVTKTGKVVRRKMGASHFRVKKSSSQKRTKRKAVEVKRSDIKSVVKYLKSKY